MKSLFYTVFALALVAVLLPATEAKAETYYFSGVEVSISRDESLISAQGQEVYGVYGGAGIYPEVVLLPLVDEETATYYVDPDAIQILTSSQVGDPFDDLTDPPILQPGPTQRIKVRGKSEGGLFEGPALVPFNQ